MFKNLRGGKRVLTLVAVLAVSMSLSSCENVRKKFVRQKKKDQAQDRDFIPVLEPQEYPAPEYNPFENYKKHYGLIKAWYQDLDNAIIARYPTGEAKYALKQIFAHIDEMQKLLAPPMQPQLEKLRGFLKFYYDNVSDPMALSNNRSRIQSDLRAFHRQLIGHLSPSKIKGSLVSAPAPAADKPS